MSLLKKLNIKIILISIVCFIMALFLLFNEFGLLKYLKLKKEVSTITNEISKVKEKNQALKNEVDSLTRKVPAKIEKVAREKYGMIRPGEKTIEIKEK
jgi:cell division protein FtsB